MRKPKRLLCVLCVAMSLVFFGIGQASAKDTIKLGFSMSLTGILSSGAAGQMEAYQVWKDLVDKKGGLTVKGKKMPVEFVYYDDQSEAGTAVKVYEKLITQDKVDLVLSPYASPLNFAVAPLSAKYKMPLVCGTASSIKLREIKNDWLWFATNCMPDKQARAVVDLLLELKVKTAAIAYLQEVYPRENLQYTEPYLKQAGIEIGVVKDYPHGEKDLKTLLSQIKAKNPDAVLFLSYPADTFTIVTQAQEAGLNPKFMYNLVGPASQVFKPKFGAAVNGISAAGNWSPKLKTFGNKEFSDTYLAKFKKLPDALDSVEGYKVCQIMEQAIEKTGSLDKQKIRDYIAKTEFPVIDGKVKFTGRENLAAVQGVLQWQNENLEVVWPNSIATAKPIYPKPAWPK